MESQQKGGKNGAAQTVGDGDGDGGDSPGRVRLMIKQIEGNDGRGNGGGKRGSVHNGGKVKRLIEELEKPKDWTGQKVEIVSDVSVKQMVQKFESENDKKIEMQIRKVKIRDSMMITPGTQVASTGKDGGKQEFPWLRNVRISGVYDDSLAKGHYSFNLHVDDKNEFILPFDEDGEEEDDDDDDDENDNGDNSERFYSDVDNDNNTVEYILPDKSQKKSLATATTATATTSAAKPQTVIAQDRKDDDDIQKQHQQKTAAAGTVAVAAHQEAEEDKESEPQKVKQEQRAHKQEQERQAKVPQEQKQEQEQQKEEQQEQQPYEEEQPIEQPQVNEEKGSENNEVHQTECPLQDINDACKEETLLEASPVQEHQELPLLQEPLLPLQPQPQPPSSFQEQPLPQAQQYHQQPELFKPEEENDDDSGENIVEISEPQQPEQPPEQPRHEQTPAVVDEEKGEVKRDEEVPMSTTVPGGLQHEVHEAENVSKAEEPLEPEQHQPCEQYEYVMSQKMPTEVLVQTPVIQQHEEQQQQEQPISQQEEKPMLQQKELGEPVNVDVNAQSTVSGPAKAEPSNAQEASRATTAKAKEERPAIIIGVNKVLYRKATAAQLLGKESSAHQPPVQPQQSPSPSIGSWMQGTRSQQRAKNAYTFFRKK